MIRYLLTLVALLLAWPAAAGPTIGVNLSGYESGGTRLGWDYVLPDDASLRYFVGKGMTTIRLPMRWERLQPVVRGPLDEARAAELEAFLDRADRAGVGVIADLHAYGRRAEGVLGSAAVPQAALPSFWSQFAKRFRGRFVGYDLMNEPHDMPSTAVWPAAAQAAIWALRKADPWTTIYVEGDGWSSATRWRGVNEKLAVTDGISNVVYSAHVYFDRDSSGSYKLPFAQDGATIATGAGRIAGFIAWCREKKVRCHVGEFGVPAGDTAWLPVLDNFMAAIFAARDVIRHVDYFAGGPWMDGYPLTLQPVKDGRWTDRPQIQTLTKAR